ncbi:MAG TPA: 30S ribosomal protein S30 [Chloroflexi bacterium]|jgi:ribosome-associated translation inhibitor RaiA|nr:30S ribosomal protein S30 [Chloroflexota bacterium]
MVATEFYVEFRAEGSPDEADLREEAERRLGALADKRDDMIGASVVIERMERAETPHRFRARVVAYVRPDNIAATEQAESARGALKGALRAIERQVREKRIKLGRPWEREDL